MSVPQNFENATLEAGGRGGGGGGWRNTASQINDINKHVQVVTHFDNFYDWIFNIFW